MLSEFIRSRFEESIACKLEFVQHQIDELAQLLNALLPGLREGKKVLIFGNGGSAADAQHIAAELVNRLLKNRDALPAIALTTDSSIITSIANDRDFQSIYSRQIEALGRPGDIALAISTSGNSPNLIKAVRTARNRQMLTVGFLGGTGGNLKEILDFSVVVHSKSTQRIQELHITFGHILCEWIEQSLFP